MNPLDQPEGPLEYPEGPRGVLAASGPDFRLGDILLLRVRYGYYECDIAFLRTPWTTPRVPWTTPRAPGAFLVAYGPDFSLGDLFYG